MRAIIIDDAKHERESLIKDIDMYCPDVEVVGQSGSPIEGVQLIHEHSPDLLFLDIELEHPSINGITMLKMLGEKNIDFQVIYVTKHSDYYIEAIRLCLCHYLVKPFNKEELINVVGLVKLIITNPEYSSPPAIPLEGMIRLPPTGNIQYQFEIVKIVRFEVGGNDTSVFLIDKEKPTIIWGMALHIPEGLLRNFAFTRPHAKHLINERYIKIIKRGKREIHMTNGEVIPLSDRNRNKF